MIERMYALALPIANDQEHNAHFRGGVTVVVNNAWSKSDLASRF